MKSELSIVLVSGGLDSAVAAAIAARQGPVAFLHANYGQRTQRRELAAFNALADHYKIEKKLVVDLAYLAAIGGSALTDPEIEMPVGNLEKEGVPDTYVPFRNAQLLSIAASWAEAIGAGSVYIGAVEEDSSGYPDCTEDFFKAFNKVVEAGTRPETCITIKTPLIHLTKKDIVTQGAELNAPLELTWSCYRNDQVACGLCDSCLLRLRGFKEAGIEDRIIYATTTT